MPAEAGIQACGSSVSPMSQSHAGLNLLFRHTERLHAGDSDAEAKWIPAYAGMTAA
jgi:hypothetical protein